MLVNLRRLAGSEKLLRSYQCIPLRHGTSIPVILVNDFEKKGKKGEEIAVKRGYARNFLIPRKIAVYATPQNKAKFQAASGKTATSQQDTSAAVTLLRSISSLHLAKAASESGSLYAAVGVDEVKELLAATHKVDVQHVYIAEPIKAVGDYAILVEGVEMNLK
eukprot:gene36191-43896_t